MKRSCAAQRAAQPETFPDLSLSIIKLLGRGEYVAESPAGGAGASHFALAENNYTHSTAPNRRFPDLVTQRLVKAAADGNAVPYTLAELTPLAEHCTKQEDAANKVERRVRKSAAALWLGDRIGQEFDGRRHRRLRQRHLGAPRCPPVEGKLESRLRRTRRRRPPARQAGPNRCGAGIRGFRESLGVPATRDRDTGAVCNAGLLLRAQWPQLVPITKRPIWVPWRAPTTHASRKCSPA